jgi:hypothetical protein
MSGTQLPADYIAELRRRKPNKQEKRGKKL